MAILAFDLGGTAVKYGIWENNQLQEISSFSTPTSFDELEEKMKAVLKELELKYEIAGIGISAPGTVDTQKGEIGGISAIPYIHRFPIKAHFEHSFKRPVTIENDANCAALAEMWQGAGKGKKNVLFVVIGTGIGGAVIMEGKLQKGKHLYGGEFGLMILDRGESFSELGTAANMAKRYSEKKGTLYTGEEVFERANQGEEDALEAVHEFYHYLTVGLYNLQFTVDPELIIIGGGISKKEELYPEINQRMEVLLAKNELKDFVPQVVPCVYRNDANLVGAVAVFSERYPSLN
ncbi:ROK family protein [Carnobacterium divergens]|uniref:N-acetylmannosamine kinase n=1 Tax=Carnobacterium divergens TaxID=2748 RepID=A0A2R7ZUH3_CARDV|nr:ROK family protein [Carnobacterium divergens]MCO6018711.1 ROK family protein [Carnobacterium divergens]TFI63964.1 N-acetylmannosamine kinase [Carnobacterium divergens]TFI74431.1 N-acetylmannosamine kinase [Carnobacterium divergens]TFI78753.1 N-acetylmannosamine kinase [Carnobacterium divergens]TFI85312.1 N-acetylmannosamine kinase [Carnobacterium divergens]